MNTRKRTGGMELNPKIRRLLDAAMRSPSGDNCQPWAFQVESSKRIQIRTVPERAKSFFDFQHHGTLLSLGAVIENITVQARAEELAVTIADFSGPVGDTRGAEVALDLGEAPGSEANEDLVRSIQTRTVNRRPFLPISPSAAKLTPVLGTPMEGIKIVVIDRLSSIARWSRMIYLADRIRYSHPEIHKELFSKILFTREMAEQRRMGLEIDRLGAGPAAKPLMQFLQPWERMEKLLRYGVDRFLAGHSRFLSMTTGVLVLLTVEHDTPEDWVRAGQQMERIWLQAQQAGLCVQPMTVALYLDQRYQKDGMEAFLPVHKPYLEEIRGTLAQLLGDETGTILFRLGYAWKMKGPAIRMPLEAFLID